MPEVLDWQTVPDPHAAVRRAVRTLRAGGLVTFPTDCAPVLAACGLAAAAVDRLCAAAPDAGPPVVAVRGAAEARDWVPAMGPLGQRLARRFWPGPLTLEFPGGADDGLVSRLPEPVRRRLCPGGAPRLRTPAHEAVLAVLDRLAEPVLLAAAPESGGDPDLAVTDAAAGAAAPTVVAVRGDGYDVIAEGAVSAEALRQQAACLVVFVCTGNTCRSPLAEALCKKLLAGRLGCEPDALPDKGFFVLSAGLSAMMGGPAAAEAVEVARQYGADLAAHQSRPLTADLAAQADYLVAMTGGHLRALAEQFPRLGVRPRLLSPAGDDVADPIGHPRAVYEACGRQIWDHLEALVAEIRP
jgi:protein-tyrosine phosphatase